MTRTHILALNNQRRMTKFNIVREHFNFCIRDSEIVRYFLRLEHLRISFFLQVDELFITALLNAKGSFLLLNQGCIKTNLKSLGWLPVRALVALRFEWLNFKTFQMSDIMHNRRCATWNKYNKG